MIPITNFEAIIIIVEYTTYSKKDTENLHTKWV